MWSTQGGKNAELSTIECLVGGLLEHCQAVCAWQGCQQQQVTLWHLAQTLTATEPETDDL